MTETLLVLAVTFILLAAASWFFKNDGAKLAPVVFVIALITGLITGLGFCLYQVVEGPFAYLDNTLAVMTGMVLIALLYAGGTFDYILNSITSKKRSAFSKAMLLLLLVAIPGMITGTAIASIATTGILVGKYLLSIGTDKKKTVEFIAVGSFLGMLMPPINFPAMIVIASRAGSYPLTYNGYFLPLLVLSVPAFIVYSVMAAKFINADSVSEKKTSKAICVLPLILAAVLVLCHNFLYMFIPFMGYPLIFTICAVVALILPAEKFNALEAAGKGITSIAPAITVAYSGAALLEMLTMTGAAGTISTKLYTVSPTIVTIVFIAIVLVTAIPFGSTFATAVALFGSYIIGALAYNIEPIYLVSLGAALCASCILCVRGGLITKIKDEFVLEDVCQTEVVKGAAVPVAIVAVTAVAMSFMAKTLLFLVF